MKKTTTITVTKEVQCCDFCESHEEMACQPATCLVCGKAACCGCMQRSLVAMDIVKPTAWSTGGSPPHPDYYWACATCNDVLTARINTLNRTTAKAMKLMRNYMDAYCGALRDIAREVDRREKKRNA